MNLIDLCAVDTESEILIKRNPPFTPDEFFDFCQANELWRMEQNANGEVEIFPLRGGAASQCIAAICAELRRWSKNDGRGTCLLNCGFRLPNGATLSPPVAWLSRAMWVRLSASEREKFPPVCPEFLIEVVSIFDSSARLERRMSEWIENGALLAWLIDPASRVAYIYRRGRAPEIVAHPAVLRGEGPVEGFALDLREVWDRDL